MRYSGTDCALMCTAIPKDNAQVNLNLQVFIVCLTDISCILLCLSKMKEVYALDVKVLKKLKIVEVDKFEKFVLKNWNQRSCILQ